MIDELNWSYNGGGLLYLLQSELSISTRQYLFSDRLYATRRNIRIRSIFGNKIYKITIKLPQYYGKGNSP